MNYQSNPATGENEMAVKGALYFLLGLIGRRGRFFSWFF